MPDLIRSARLFEASTRLQSASSRVSRLAHGEKPSDESAEDLKWAGSLLKEVDWESGSSKRSPSDAHLAVQATSVRPTFYATILKMEPADLQQIGVRSEKDLLRFLSAFYEFLCSGGAKSHRPSLSVEKMEFGAQLLHRLSQSLLLQLNNNMLPPRSRHFTLEPVGR